jgi:hypothetical protein
MSGEKSDKPQQHPQSKPSQPAPSVEPQTDGTRAGAGLSGVLAERSDALDKVRYRMTGGAHGTPPAGNIAAQRRAVVGEAAARIMRKASGAAGAGQVPKGSGSPLAPDVKTKMESKLGADLSSVRVHTGGDSAKAATDFGARAFTVGSDVHFNAGQFAPGSKEGDKLLAHELTHVVQGQKSGVQRKAEQDGGDAPAGASEAKDAAHGDEGKTAEVSDPSDPAEQEAEQVSEKVAGNLEADKDKPGEKKKGGDKGDAATTKDGAEAKGDSDHKASGDKAAHAKEPAPAIGAKLDGIGTKLYLKGNGGAKRDSRLGSLKTPNLDALAQLEGDGVYARYLDDYDVYADGSKAKNKQPKLQYLEGRAARKLGRSAERESIAAYGAKSGFAGGKNNTAIEILSNSGKVLRERIPDLFDAASVVGDVKMVKEQSLDAQMRDNVVIANAQNVRIKGQTKLLKNKLRFDLLVSGPSDQYPTGTHVSQTLIDEIQGTGGSVWEITDK